LEKGGKDKDEDEDKLAGGSKGDGGKKSYQDSLDERYPTMKE